MVVTRADSIPLLTAGAAAWCVSVLPSASGDSVRLSVAVAGLIAFIALPFIPAGSPNTPRLIAFWSLIVTSSAVWLLDLSRLARRFDAWTGTATVICWATLAVLAASPVGRRESVPSMGVLRRAGPEWLLALVAAVALHATGWRASSEGRGVLVRIAAGVGGVLAFVLAARMSRGKAPSRLMLALVMAFVVMVAAVCAVMALFS